MMLLIAVFCLALSLNATAAHVDLSCGTCHRQGGNASDPAASTNRAAGCAGCHRGYERIFDHAMGTRSGEKRFVQRSYGRFDSGFWDKNCNSCHVSGCLDCHADGGLAKPSVAACQRCHNGYYTGWDYSGRAPREDNMRYQRGISVNGAPFLKMLPDVHYSAGMTCGACHSMSSLAEGKKSSKGCRDCHKPDLKSSEHCISAHLE
ncbi:MAG: selenite/tellurite reduction operon b-type cytochrome iron-sulfur cluster-binding subunit ExtO, partial [Desulfuromonadaceae bacterium]|nr:selenite/tellurite reduction operon b-type cytochrome iron-sulfur cluster-binding subunit ExtO [Desulfuromonadaceae bacterium]